MKRVAIFTNFSSHDNAYSLCGVVADQIKMCLMAGNKPVLIVQESGWWKDPEHLNKIPHKHADIKFLPPVPCHNEVRIDPTFNDDVEKVYQALKVALEGIDVVLTHDIIYQPAALIHHVAARRIAKEFPDLKWFHWIHSATSPFTLTTEVQIFKDAYIENIREKFPNSKYVFFNHYSIPRIAHNFGIKEEDVAIVHHPTDAYEMFRFDAKMAQFANKYKLLEADYIAVYPCRLDRGKQVEYMIKTMAALKKMGQKVRAIVVDFHSTGGDKLTYRDWLKEVGINSGLTTDELIWTSEFLPEWKASVPRKYISMLFSMSNVFVMPCRSESYSLVTQEAALFGNIIVANEDFIPFRDILGEHVIWAKYSSNIDKMNGLDGNTDTKYNNEDMYHLEIAMKVMAEANKSKIFQQKQRVRKTRNLDYIMKNELIPLIYQ